MQPLPFATIAGTFGGAVLFALVFDLIKVPVFRRLQIT
jgi:hypothetical protein